MASVRGSSATGIRVGIAGDLGFASVGELGGEREGREVCGQGASAQIMVDRIDFCIV